jgi:hypothetical protein
VAVAVVIASMTSFLFIIKVPVEDEQLKKKESTAEDKQTGLHAKLHII